MMRACRRNEGCLGTFRWQLSHQGTLRTRVPASGGTRSLFLAGLDGPGADAASGQFMTHRPDQLLKANCLPFLARRPVAKC
jgi:hypothetical protein